jgi:hypothetical protein
VRIVRQRALAIIHCALACAIPCRAPAQADFRRGDVNADGAVDIADIDQLGRWLYLEDPAPQCLATADTNDDGVVNDGDEAFLIACLFNRNPDFAIPPPGPDVPGPDPTPGPGCAAYSPAAAAPLASFSLGFDCAPAMGAPGETVVFEAFATLTTAGNTTGQGAEGWSIGIGVEGFHLAGTTTDGTAAAFTTADPPGYRDPGSSFEDNGYWNLGREEGLIAAVLLGRRESTGAALPPAGTVRILGLRLQATIPPGGVATGRLFFAVEDEQEVTKPVPNRVALRGISHVPALESCDIRVMNDCNGNGRVDVLDISTGASLDCTSNGTPDECEPDCNGNAMADSCDIASGERDCDANGIPDSCDPASATDCNQNGVYDACDLADGTSKDCNGNAIPDSCDIAGGTSDDCDANGIPDSCDVGRPWSEDCNGNGKVDACDIVTRQSLDADQSGVPDECERCPGGGPVECPGDGGPAFRYGFRGPCGASGEAGAEIEVLVFGRIETHCLEAGSTGAYGWALSVVVEGCRPIEATTRGTHAAPTTEGGLRDPLSGFEKTTVVDPVRNGGKMGAVSATFLDTLHPVTLPPEESPHDIIRLTLAATASPACSECILRYEDGLIGMGTPISNVVTFQGENVRPLLGEMRIEVCPTSAGGVQKPGDENQDGSLNISDPVSLLNHLFSGTNPALPCGDGTLDDPANLAILDLNGSGAIDLSDPIHALNFLFSGGPPPAMGRYCLWVRGCPAGCGA